MPIKTSGHISVGENSVKWALNLQRNHDYVLKFIFHI